MLPSLMRLSALVAASVLLAVDAKVEVDPSKHDVVKVSAYAYLTLSGVLVRSTLINTTSYGFS